MVRPRWHDALIIAAIVALLGVGVWALWWDDVVGYFQGNQGPAGEKQPTLKPQT
jgi:hypothetical protein